MGKFKVGLFGFSTKTSEALKEIPLDATVELATRIKQSTPFKTGRAAAHWEVRDNQNFTYDPKKTGDPNDLVFVGVDYWTGEPLYIGNAVPYAEILEEQGSNSVSPGHMVQMNVDFWQEIVEVSAKKKGFT